MPQPSGRNAAPVGGLAPPFTHSLAGRLLRVIFGCYFVVALVVTGVQMATEYRHALQRLDDTIAAMQRTFGPGLEDAMWRFNGEVVRGILTGMREMPVVVGVEVRDEHGGRVQALGTIAERDGHPRGADAAGPVEPASHLIGGLYSQFSRTFDLVHIDENGGRHAVGAWTVYSSDRIALDQVTDTLIVILINSVIKTLTLWFIFFVVIDRMVGRPLTRISAFLADLDVDNLGSARLVLSTGGWNELNGLAFALNLVMSRLRRSVEDNAALMRDLKDMNATLQARVTERTQELELLARTDLLTGLFNRRKLDEALETSAGLARRNGDALSVILGDIDHFKSVNDHHGHKIGDVVLVAFAATLREGMRTTDTLGRWGGEEFLVVCPGLDLPGAEALAERLRRRMEDTSLPVAGVRTCSFGVADLHPGESTDSLVARADAALYAAKRRGRNRVEASTSSSNGIGLAVAARLEPGQRHSKSRRHAEPAEQTVA